MDLCTPFTNFFDFCLRSSRYDNKYLPMLSKLSQASLVKIFQISGGWVSWHPKGGGVHSPINPEVFFRHIDHGK